MDSNGVKRSVKSWTTRFWKGFLKDYKFQWELGLWKFGQYSAMKWAGFPLLWGLSLDASRLNGRRFNYIICHQHIFRRKVSWLNFDNAAHLYILESLHALKDNKNKMVLIGPYLMLYISLDLIDGIGIAYQNKNRSVSTAILCCTLLCFLKKVLKNCLFWTYRKEMTQ